MNIFLSIFIFLISIFIHELTHIFIHWYLLKEWSKVKINKFGSLKIISKQIMNYKQSQLFLGVPIITGFLSYIFFINLFPYEGSLACIAYLISCGFDFWNLIKLEVRKL